MFDSWVVSALNIAAAAFIVMAGLLLLIIVVLYVVDKLQTRHTIRRNYPVIGRFRYWFEHLGEFFRQYFFALDREELPFNRAQRSWAYRAAKNLSNTIGFGSTRDLRREGTVMFANAVFPRLAEEAPAEPAVTIGPHCRHPYSTARFFHISAMSYGALSRPAVRALSRGAAQAGIWINTGEGGLSPHHLEGGGDVIFQIGTAKYGVRDLDGNFDPEKLKTLAANPQVKMVEIKLAQGAKPGKGGILPGAKVTEEIADIRGISAGKDSISPNRHIDIGSTDELLDKVNQMRELTGKPVGFKCVISDFDWLTELCEAIAKRPLEQAPDFITLDSCDGGTGAAPQTLMDDVGLPIRESLPQLVDALNRHQLRERIKVICSGKLVTPTEVTWALCMGADFVVSARGYMFALGCIQAMQCHKNTCPTGVTTHDKGLQRGLVVADKSVRVMHYANNMHKAVQTIAHTCGVDHVRQLRRQHARIVVANGKSASLAELYPDQKQQD